MRTFFTWLANFFAFLFAIVFIVTLFAALILVSAEYRLFDAATYKRAFESVNLYERMPKLMAEQIISSMTANPCEENPLTCLPPEQSELRTCLERNLTPEAFIQLSAGARKPTPEESATINFCSEQHGPIPSPKPENAPTYLKYLTVQDWETLIGTLVPPDQMKAITEQTIDDVFAYLNGQKPEAAVSFAPLKQNLSKNGAIAAQKILSAQPDCTPDQLLALSANLALGLDMGQQSLCKPPAEFNAIALPLIEAGLQAESAAIPDQILILNANDQPVTAYYVQLARTVMRMGLLVPLLFLILITLMVVRSLKGWLGWWGIPLAITGLLAEAATLAGVPIARYFLASQAFGNISVYAQRFAQAGSDVIFALIREIMLPVGIVGAIMLVLGVGMTIGRQFVPEKSEEEA